MSRCNRDVAHNNACSRTKCPLRVHFAADASVSAMAKFIPFVIALLLSGNAYSFDILDVELGKPFPNDLGPSNKKLNAILPTDTIKVSNSGTLANIFADYEIWVLSEKKRRAAIVMANRVFQDLNECENTKSQLREAITEKLGTADFPFSETVESDPSDGTEYIFSCRAPSGSPYILLNFVVRNGKMSKEFQRISNEKLQKFNNRGE